MDEVTGSDPSPRADASYDVLDTGVHTPTWRERWAATGATPRLLITVAAALIAAAAVAGSAAAHVEPRYRIQTVAGPAPPAPVTTDSAGCPVTIRCSVRAEALPDVRAAFLRAFPGGVVLSGQRTDELDGTRTFRAAFEGQIGDQTTIDVISQCVPGSTTPPDSVLSSASSRKDLSGNIVVSSRQVTVVAGGAAGCSVFLWLDAFDLSRNYEPQTVALARDSALQLAR